MRENSAEEQTLQLPYLSSRKENILLQFTPTFLRTQEFRNLTGLGSAKLCLILSDFFSPHRTNNPKLGQKKAEKALACGKKIHYGKGNFMIKTPWKIVASKTDHCFSGGSNNFNFPLATAPIISHSLISTCSPHIAPGLFAQEGNKVLETWVSFFDRLLLARQKSPCPSITVDFSF